ncbi:DUF1036 domain-containing protein [Mameliella alba]|uniref:Integral membrane protein n=1 Tax=Mameliella alba TaxID=561184 RepID=A0A0B3S1R5_9RHOB|nr:DUF1036 domain-containing protein [Mameliella alba]KHQ54262.1 hypothetical protein OA50_00853 [Mameliella alba]
MNRWISGATGLVLGALPLAAQAGLEVCNTTDLRHSVAIGYEAPGGVWTSEGWWQLAPGECKPVMGRDLGRRYFYYRATTPGGDFDGPFSFCSTPDPFTIAGDKDCAARGYDKTRFRKVDTGNAADFTLTLVADGPAPVAPKGAADLSDEEAPLESLHPFARGSLGEPFTQNGIFTGCELIDGLDYCSFEVEGWRYHAYYGAGTADALLDDLQYWPMPLAVELEGDMIAYGDITVEIALGRVTEVFDGDFFSEERHLMQGEWQSLDDPASRMTIRGADVYDYYNGAFSGHQWMTLGGTCPDAPFEGIGWTRTELETQDSWCVHLGEVTADRLELINPGQGNILTYSRVD